MELTFAPASAQDADSIFTLCKKLIDDYEDLRSIDYDKVMSWVRRKIDKNISEYQQILLAGQLSGYFRFHPEDGMMEIDDFFILPQFQNRGIGTAVLRKCCAETTLPVMLYVFIQNTGAMALYQRMGFRITQSIGESRCIMVRQPDREVL